MNRDQNALSGPAVQALMAHRELLEEAIGFNESDDAANNRRAAIERAHRGAADALRQAMQRKAAERQPSRKAA